MNHGIFIEDFIGLDEHIIDNMRAAIAQTLQLHCEYDADVFISITDETEMRSLNEQTRGIDKPTDVLSFPYIDFPQGQTLAQAAASEPMKNPETGRLMLGDIIICLDIAKQQAEEYGHSLVREMCFLSVHGQLHLLGFDHQTERDEAEMFAEQERILGLCAIER